MAEFGIVKSNYFSFEKYKQLVDKYYENDPREINFQNRVILTLLDKIFINDEKIWIVDVSTQFKNRESEQHTREMYANDYTPDLLIVKKWKYNNINKPSEDYLAVVEIKSPKLDPIRNNNNHTSKEVDNYIKIGRKVILTDCFEWRFYGFGENPKSFTLHDENDWVMEEVKNPEFIVNEMGFPKKRKESKVWSDLCDYIHNNIK